MSYAFFVCGPVPTGTTDLDDTLPVPPETSHLSVKQKLGSLFSSNTLWAEVRIRLGSFRPHSQTGSVLTDTAAAPHTDEY